MIPVQLGRLSKLEELLLRKNHLNGVFPASLGDLSNLEFLWVGGGNEFEGCVPNGLRDVPLNDLHELELSFCESAAASEEDREALVALYEATAGDDWTDNTNWLSDEPLSEWHGVTVAQNGRVAEMDLRSNGLTGEIPVELAYLTALEKLYLFGNRLSGEIPAELCSLSELRWLYLNNN